jgi:putative membrane protein (TIGR04086 family)
VRELLAEVDWRAVGAGMVTALIVAVPVTLVGQAVDSFYDDDPVWLRLLVLPVLVGFVLGGYGAARRRPTTPLIHGTLAAFGAFLVVQAVGIGRQLFSGDDVAWLAIVFNGLVAACLGTIGGIVANRQVEARS